MKSRWRQSIWHWPPNEVREVLDSKQKAEIKKILRLSEYLCITALLTIHTGVTHNEYCHINMHTTQPAHSVMQECTSICGAIYAQRLSS